MEKLTLNGKWSMKEVGGEIACEASVPGCNFLDLKRAGLIPDPLIGTNENDVQWVAQKDWLYERTFEVAPTLIDREKIELVFEMVDTLCDITLNGKKIGSGNNINRTYVFDVKDVLHAGENRLQIVFYSPFAYIAERQKANSLPNSTMGEAGSCHIRKTPYHFGWDWGPHLLPAGIGRDVYLRAYDVARIDDVIVRQKHRSEDGAVSQVELNILAQATADADGLKFRFTLYDGEEIAASGEGAEGADLTVLNPKIWWCSGLGAQPLYRLNCQLIKDGQILDERDLTVGLRTIELDTKEDAIGKNFRFIVNGEPIFAKGANWIATDSFVNQTTPEQLEELIAKAKAANFNMLRVWGGAYYESDLFYELCDRYGILAWQDCNFACSPYPFNEPEFLENVRLEIIDNVKRLRHHASLCLWCGNNEIESMSMAWMYRTDVIKQTGTFFYTTLRKWIRALDDQTPYWATTPSSGEYMKKINHDNYGDTHLWHVWHGLRPLEFYRKRNTRFCSEFGIESLPSLNALDTFAGEGDLNLDMPVMKLHQKCMGGNSKMLYYVLLRYWEPAQFKDMVYMTQIAQMECVREATEHWRRQKGRCNGSLYWQYNDCWGVSSWSGMDYYGNLKAVQYGAKHFDAPVTVTVENTVRNAKIYAHNDTLEALSGEVRYGIATFAGEEICCLRKDCELAKGEVKHLADLRYDAYVRGSKQKECYCFVSLSDRSGKVLSERTFPLLREKDSKLPATEIDCVCELAAPGLLQINLQAAQYARYVFVRMKGWSKPFSDNFFDLTPNKIKRIQIQIPSDWTLEEVQERLSVCSMSDIAPKSSRFADQLKKTKIFLMPVNFVNWVARFFDN